MAGHHVPSASFWRKLAELIAAIDFVKECAGLVGEIDAFLGAEDELDTLIEEVNNGTSDLPEDRRR